MSFKILCFSSLLLKFIYFLVYLLCFISFCVLIQQFIRKGTYYNNTICNNIYIILFLFFIRYYLFDKLILTNVKDNNFSINYLIQ